jgi:hypothetical protein
MGAGWSVNTCQPADAEFFRERDQKIHAAAESFSSGDGIDRERRDLRPSNPHRVRRPPTIDGKDAEEFKSFASCWFNAAVRFGEALWI